MSPTAQTINHERKIDMLLYHGTMAEFTEPCLGKCKPHRDFGCGFYLTPNYIDALTMTIKNSRVGFVQSYGLDNMADLSVLELSGYSDEWLEFVVRSRLGQKSNFDLVIGNMAGGGRNLKSKFSKYRGAKASVEEVMAAMRHELTSTTLGVQYAFLTPKAVSRLKLLDVETIMKEDLA